MSLTSKLGAATLLAAICTGRSTQSDKVDIQNTGQVSAQIVSICQGDKVRYAERHSRQDYFELGAEDAPFDSTQCFSHRRARCISFEGNLYAIYMPGICAYIWLVPRRASRHQHLAKKGSSRVEPASMRVSRLLEDGLFYELPRCDNLNGETTSF